MLAALASATAAVVAGCPGGTDPEDSGPATSQSSGTGETSTGTGSDPTATVDRSTARSLEDRRGVDYLAPLAGVGRGAVDRLVDAHLTVRAGPSESLSRADYEAELRARLADRAGPDAVASVFPDHEQTVVRGRRPTGDGDTPK